MNQLKATTTATTAFNGPDTLKLQGPTSLKIQLSLLRRGLPETKRKKNYTNYTLTKKRKEKTKRQRGSIGCPL